MGDWVAYDLRPRCQCNRLLAEMVTRPWTIMCPRCKTVCHSTDRQTPPFQRIIERTDP